MLGVYKGDLSVSFRCLEVFGFFGAAGTLAVDQPVRKLSVGEGCSPVFQ